MPDARTEILDRICQELGRPASAPADAQSAYSNLPRTYRRRGQSSSHVAVEKLLDRLLDYDAEVIELDEPALAAAIADVLARHLESVLLIPGDLPESWLPLHVELVRDVPGADAVPLAALTRGQAVLTACAGAIAETGTILLDHGPRQGRRVLTLLPDHHLCVLRRDQVVETVSEGFALLSANKAHAITTISGPSATADIEMTRIRGVHGPRRLTVFLLP